MARSESNVQREMIFKYNTGNTRVFRNNVGSATTDRGEFISFGLCKGSGDLIGWEQVEITPEMVGTKIARFLSIEVKTMQGKLSDQQKIWLDNVNKAGGKAIVERG